LMGYGIYLLYPPVAFISVGFILFITGSFLGKFIRK